MVGEDEQFHALEEAVHELQRLGAAIKQLYAETEKVADAHARGFLQARFVGEVVHWTEVEHRFRVAMAAYEATVHSGRQRLREHAAELSDDYSISQLITVAGSTGSASAASGGPVQS
jgi:hypothetical protein